MTAHEVTWQRGLAALRRYAAVKGTARVSLGARAGRVDIGSWADTQRAQYWAGTLHPQRCAALESLPGWDWSGKHQRKWHSRLAALRRYARTHDVGEVPVDAAVDRLRIGAWAAAQRAAHAAGTLPARNAAVLETIFGWTWKTDHDECHDHSQRRATTNSSNKHTPSRSHP
jgi:hypothetical protein